MKSTFSLSFFLKRSAQRKSGEMPIIGRISVNNQAVEFRPQLIVMPKNWSVEKGRAIGHSPEAVQLNGLLDSIRTTITKHYQDLVSSDGHVTDSMSLINRRTRTVFINPSVHCMVLYPFRKNGKF